MELDSGYVLRRAVEAWRPLDPLRERREYAEAVARFPKRSLRAEWLLHSLRRFMAETGRDFVEAARAEHLASTASETTDEPEQQVKNQTMP